MIILKIYPDYHWILRHADSVTDYFLLFIFYKQYLVWFDHLDCLNVGPRDGKPKLIATIQVEVTKMLFGNLEITVTKF
jgi:hypothetical protein